MAKNSFTKICDTCSSEYQITETKMTYRDVDHISCEVCGEIIKEWNGAVTYSSKILKKGSRQATILSSTTAYKITNGDAINTNIIVEPGACEVISPIQNFNMMASDLVPIPGIKQFYQVKKPSNLFILANFIAFA